MEKTHNAGFKTIMEIKKDLAEPLLQNFNMSDVCRVMHWLDIRLHQGILHEVPNKAKLRRWLEVFIDEGFNSWDDQGRPAQFEYTDEGFRLLIKGDKDGEYTFATLEYILATSAA